MTDKQYTALPERKIQELQRLSRPRELGTTSHILPLYGQCASVGAINIGVNPNNIC